MLVLTRRAGEKVVIGNEIVVEILSIGAENVRLGIAAPRETSVHRYEVFAEIQESNRAAATSEIDKDSIENIAVRLRNQK